MRSYPAAAFALLALTLGLGAFAAPAAVPASALTLGPGDLRIEQLSDGGYHLYVRAKAGLGSILLTESTADPSLKTDSYAYRSLDKNAVNGSETRILDGKTMPSSSGLHFLVDSSPEPDAALGRAFHVFIPWVVAWGYPWSRSGKVFIHDGTFINIRAFAKSHADYSGPFAENPYLIRVSQSRGGEAPVAAPAPAAPAVAKAAEPATAPAPAEPPVRVPAKAVYKASLYLPETIAAFSTIASESRGELRFASSDPDIARQIGTLLDRHTGKALDLVFCLDATDTMILGVDALKARLPALLSARVADFPSLRLGLVAFKDYFEEYLYRRSDFTHDIAVFAAALDSVQCGGGRDIPEAVFEGLYAASTEFPWASAARLVVLVGDAPPHPLPRGSVDAGTVAEAAASAGLEVDAVAVPK